MHNYIYCSCLNVIKYLGSDEKRKRTELFASWNTNMYHSGSSSRSGHWLREVLKTAFVSE